MKIEYILDIIAVLLFLIWLRVDNIAKRLKEHFPTEKERDYELSQTDPHSHWEQHKDD